MKTQPVIPFAAEIALKKLGEDIKNARRRRQIPTALMAERAFISRMTLYKLERGSPSVAFGHYATVLFILGHINSLRDLLDISNDPVGQALDLQSLPKTIHSNKAK